MLVDDVAVNRHVLLVLQRDDSVIDWDRGRLYALARDANRPLLRDEHRRTGGEQILMIPDAIGGAGIRAGIFP